MTDHGAVELGQLADPGCFNGPIDVNGWGEDLLSRMRRDMLTIRAVEEEVGRLAERGLARAPCHLGIGQEAVAVGVSFSLNSDDRVFGGHRSHSHYLALGGDAYALFAEILGKADGTSKGMGGSMHLLGREVGFYGSVPIVGATIPIAVGAVPAAKMDGNGAVGVTYFGDGAAEEGVLHESLNTCLYISVACERAAQNQLRRSDQRRFRIPAQQVSESICRRFWRPWPKLSGPQRFAGRPCE